jgi:hypothetical protein
MAFTVIRVSPVLLVILAAASTATAAQSLDKADLLDFQMFRQSIALRHNARVCERSVPEYGKTFGVLYDKWSEKRREEIARGESLYKDALKRKDPKADRPIDRATLKSIEEQLAELKKPPQAAGATPPDAPTTAVVPTAAACEKVLTFLRQEN